MGIMDQGRTEVSCVMSRGPRKPRAAPRFHRPVQAKRWGSDGGRPIADPVRTALHSGPNTCLMDPNREGDVGRSRAHVGRNSFSDRPVKCGGDDTFVTEMESNTDGIIPGLFLCNMSAFSSMKPAQAWQKSCHAWQMPDKKNPSPSQSMAFNPSSADPNRRRSRPSAGFRVQFRPATGSQSKCGRLFKKHGLGR